MSRLLSCVVISALLASTQTSSAQSPYIWTQAGFKDFATGRFGDAGANIYVSAGGRIQLINRWDLNNDGHIDLVLANSHQHVEKLDATIYWGNGQDFDGSRVSHIPNEGAQWTVVADLNGDGLADAVIPNYANGTWSKMDSAIYYGGTIPQKRPINSGVSSTPWAISPFVSKTALPTEAAQQAAVGDLNKDGYADIVFALSSGFWEYRGGGDALSSPSRIFWGSLEGFDRKRYLDIEAAGAADVAVGDLNKDGWPDLVLANRERAGKFNVGSYVYWGSDKGFSSEQRIELPTRQVNAVTLADANGDGFTDILFANGQGPTSYVYLNRGGAFTNDARVELPTTEARDCAAADLNGDGFTDLFFTNHQVAGNPLALSYLYWGGPQGFSAERRQEFETVGAWGVSLADLNKDDRIDIVVSNYREFTSYDVPSYIFWNGPSGFSNAMRTSLFTRGAIGNAVADFNGDGHLDVVFNNTVGRSRGGVEPSFIYWGNAKGEYSVRRRLDLPTVEAYSWAGGDLNDDGWVDLIFANEAEVGRRITENFIYWGGPQGLSTLRRSALVGDGGRSLGLADLDRDGYLDVIVFNTKPADPGVFIYWGTRHGYVTTQRTEFPGEAAGLPTIADLNHDGHLDLVVPDHVERSSAIYWGDGTRGYTAARRSVIPGSVQTSSSEVADLNRDGNLDLILTRRGEKLSSYVYYGNGSREFTTNNRTEFNTVQTQGVTVGDINKDGWLDIVAPTYSTNGSRATLSKVFVGGQSGIPQEPTIQLPTNAGTGSQISDYNHDGYNDLLLVNHRSEGDPNKTTAFSDHATDSYLYWGGPGGFRIDRKLLIPSRGAHYDRGVDLGNIYDRGFRFDYVSPAHKFGNRRGERLEWKATTPFGTQVEFQIRTATQQEDLGKAPWTGPLGPGTFYRTPGSRMQTAAGHSWIQYRAVLISPNGAVSPVLERVSLRFSGRI